MSKKPSSLVHQTSTTTGSGNFTLSAVNGKRSFDTAFGNGATTDVFDYFISNQSAAEWEIGTGHMSDATTLVRDTVVSSSNANAAVTFSAGTKDVTNDIPANENIFFGDATGIFDTNSNEQLIFQQTASAVNYLEITNAATGNAPLISGGGAAERGIGIGATTLADPGAGNLAFGNTAGKGIIKSCYALSATHAFCGGI